MEFNLFLWPMLIPMLLPLFYCIKYKKESLKYIISIIFVLTVIIILYWPLLSSNFFSSYTYLIVKYLLFFIFPLAFLLFINFKRLNFDLQIFGIGKKGFKKSILLSFYLLPIMLIVSFLIKYINGITYESDFSYGIISFFESFTEEFLFRGVLFIFLLDKTNLKIAYATSLFSFVLMHPQHIENYLNLFLISTIIQGILTIEIARRSENIAGAWILHGINRFFIIAIMPFLLIK